jgi:ribosome maturation factor RimP
LSSVIETCREIGQPIIEQLGFQLVDVEYVKEGRNFVLRFLVDNEQGIDIDECAIISERMSEVLDRLDPIKEEYMLEISSPGAERPLKTRNDVAKAVGKYVNVRLYAPVLDCKEFEGDLIAFNDDRLTIQYKVKTSMKTIELNYDQISKIRLAIKF